jgi:hypothetical protein
MPYSWASYEVRKQSRSMSFAICSVGRRAGHGLRYAQVVDVALGEAAIVVDDRDVVLKGAKTPAPPGKRGICGPEHSSKSFTISSTSLAKLGLPTPSQQPQTRREQPGKRRRAAAADTPTAAGARSHQPPLQPQRFGCASRSDLGARRTAVSDIRARASTFETNPVA